MLRPEEAYPVFQVPHERVDGFQGVVLGPAHPRDPRSIIWKEQLRVLDLILTQLKFCCRLLF